MGCPLTPSLSHCSMMCQWCKEQSQVHRNATNPSSPPPLSFKTPTSDSQTDAFNMSLQCHIAQKHVEDVKEWPQTCWNMCFLPMPPPPFSTWQWTFHGHCSIHNAHRQWYTSMEMPTDVHEGWGRIAMMMRHDSNSNKSNMDRVRMEMKTRMTGTR
jgi:hypothetical protein